MSNNKITNKERRKTLIGLLAFDRHISGEKLAADLGISRTMLWKEVNFLRDQGFLIESQQSRGYKILAEPECVSPDLIASKIKELRYLGKKIVCFDSIDSTHTYAKILSTSLKTSSGIILLAKRQSKGRGRLGRNWASPEGGIWMSVILKPELPISDMTKIGLSAALSGVDMLKSFGISAGIKWPNDIMAENKKIGGVLLDAAGEADCVSTLILSIGININFELNAIEKLAPESTTALEIVGKAININDACARLLLALDSYLHLTYNNQWNKVFDKIKQNDYLKGKKINLLMPGAKEVSGDYVGITESGHLKFLKDGKTEYISIGEITRVLHD